MNEAHWPQPDTAPAIQSFRPCILVPRERIRYVPDIQKRGAAVNILILGGGGREHSLAWAVKQNPKCDRLIVAPGNAGIADLAECADLDIENGGAVAEFAGENGIDFVIIGPEAPLAAGVSDRLRDAGLLVFGPSQAAAALEASKAFTKEVCDAAGAPTAAWARFTDVGPRRTTFVRRARPLW